MSVTSTFGLIRPRLWGNVCEDINTGPGAYIRDPVPKVMNGVGMLDEEELQSLARKHIAANRLDQEAVAVYSSKADALRAELNEWEAKAKQATASLNRGREVAELLNQSIRLRARQREAMESVAAKRKRSPEPNAMRVPSKRQMIHLPSLAARECANRCLAPADDNPRGYFVHAIANHPLAKSDHPTGRTRMVSYQFPEKSILIYIDGSCLNQNSRHDTQSRRGGCAVVYGTTPPSGQRTTNPCGISFRLENRGCDGKCYVATSNRAELRAATAALECRMWGTEGWRFVTIATDSTYVVEGITDWVVKWKNRQWTKSTGEDVANRDLWERLLYLINEQARSGCDVRFWHINRNLNDRADRWAKLGAERSEAEGYRVVSLSETQAGWKSSILP